MTHLQDIFILQVGWIHIQVNCHAVPSALTPLKNRYMGFLTTSPKDSPQIQISILTPHTQPIAGRNKTPQFSSDQLTFCAPGWEGEFDWTTNSGWIRPSAEFLYEETDYFLRAVCAVQAFHSGGFLLHAAGIVRNQCAYVFLGRSGAGKTTISRLSGVQNVLNDDLILLRPNDAEWRVYSTPFYNPTQVKPCEHRSAPLKGLYRLVQDKIVALEPVSQGQALAETVASVPVVSANAERMIELIARCQTLLKHVPVFHLHFRKDDSFWEVIEGRGA